MKQVDRKQSASTAPQLMRGQPFFAPRLGTSSSLFFGPAVVQPKLEISHPTDPCEREADAMAENVLQHTATSPTLTTAASIQRKCADCEKEEKLHRKEATTAEPSTGAGVLHQLTDSAGSGSPLRPGIRSDMESGFGYDFADVRVHTDDRAIRLNRQLNAHAFTYGSDIYFNDGQYNTDSPDGWRLLAHELTHVVQQGSGVRRKQIQRETEVTVTVDNVPGACSLEQHREIEPAVRQARTWLQTTIRRLDAYIGNPTREPGVLAALERHFHSSTAETAGRVRRVLNRISSEMLTRADLQTECHPASDTSCNDAGAYVSDNQWVFCPTFFGASANWQAATIIHEMAHTLTGLTHITDRAYRSNRMYRILSTIEALTNADSYETFCLELVTGTALNSTAPQDETNDCSDRQATPIRRSLAQLERWNRNAQVLTNDKDPAMLSQWQDLQTRHLGGTTAATIRRGKQAYDRVYNKMKSALTFECERTCDRNVTGYYRYFLFITSDTLHLCPMLFSMNEDDRTHAIYQLILIRFGDVSEAFASELANLAKSLNDRFWAVPTSLTGFD